MADALPLLPALTLQLQLQGLATLGLDVERVRRRVGPLPEAPDALVPTQAYLDTWAEARCVRVSTAPRWPTATRVPTSSSTTAPGAARSPTPTPTCTPRSSAWPRSSS